MPLLKDPEDEEGLLRSHTKRLEFPPDVYPPHWDVDDKKDAGRKNCVVRSTTQTQFMVYVFITVCNR